jgi:hypothetical protein
MPSILKIRKRPSHEKDSEDPYLSKSAINNRVYCIVWYLSIVCCLKGTGLPSGCDIGLTDTFFLPRCNTFGRRQRCITTSRGRGQRCITILNKVKVQRCIRYTLLVCNVPFCLDTYIHKVVQFLRNSFIDLAPTELVRFGHLGLGLADLVLDTQLLQYLRYEKKTDPCSSLCYLSICTETESY